MWIFRHELDNLTYLIIQTSSLPKQWWWGTNLKKKKLLEWEKKRALCRIFSSFSLQLENIYWKKSCLPNSWASKSRAFKKYTHTTKCRKCHDKRKKRSLDGSKRGTYPEQDWGIFTRNLILALTILYVLVLSTEIKPVLLVFNRCFSLFLVRFLVHAFFILQTLNITCILRPPVDWAEVVSWPCGFCVVCSLQSSG